MCVFASSQQRRKSISDIWMADGAICVLLLVQSTRLSCAPVSMRDLTQVANLQKMCAIWYHRTVYVLHKKFWASREHFATNGCMRNAQSCHSTNCLVCLREFDFAVKYKHYTSSVLLKLVQFFITHQVPSLCFFPISNLFWRYFLLVSYVIVSFDIF